MNNKINFVNTSDLVFEDISSESYRIYNFITNNGKIVSRRFNNPIKLNVSKSGGHRLFTEDGICHYISPKWIDIEWVVKSGEPHFIK